MISTEVGITSWRMLYRLAMAESNPARIAGRIESARQAINQRDLELVHHPNVARHERPELDTALRNLWVHEQQHSN